MTPVREIQGGAIRVAVGSALVAALKSESQTFVAYVNFDTVLDNDWLIAFQNEANSGAESWSSFGKENGKLRFFPGGEGGEPPAKVWGLAVATWDQSASAWKFYFYDFSKNELKALGSGTNAMTWFGIEPKHIQFGLWNGTEEFNGKYAAAAIFGGKALSAGEIEALAKAETVADWAASEPTALWIFDQKGSGEHVVDEMGHGADQGGIAQGTTLYVEATLPLPLRVPEAPEEHPGAEAPTFVGAKTDTGLEAAKRYVKTDVGLVEIT